MKREGKVYVFDHPLIQHKVTLMRDIHTSTKEFRELAREVVTLMTFEATRDLPLKDVEIETPMTKCTMKMLAGEDIAVVPILRAGLGFVDGMLDLIPNAKVGHIGLYRDPETHEPVEYYCKLPADIEKREVLILRDDAVGGNSLLALLRVIGDEDQLHAVLIEIIFKRRLRGFHMPFDDRVVATFGDDMLPGILQSFPGFVVLGENQNAGSVFVQTVDDEDSGFRIFLGDIVRD